MNSKDTSELVKLDPDYVLARRHGFSLTKLLERYPEGVTPQMAAEVLGMTEEEVEEVYQGAVVKLRETMKVS